MPVVFEKFNSFDEMAKVAKKRPKIWHCTESRARGWEAEEFTRTKSFAEAEEFLLRGYPDAAQAISTELNNFNKEINIVKSQIKYDVYGTSVSVGRAIAGHPRNMIRRQAVPQKLKAVKIYYANVASCDVNSANLLKAGITMLKIVTLLESKQIRVELNVLPKVSSNDGYLNACCCKIKDAQQPLDVLKISYPLCHPSAFRRHGFLWYEKQPDIKIKSSNYGVSMTSGEIKQNFPQIKHDLNAVILTFRDIHALRYNENDIITKYFNNIK